MANVAISDEFNKAIKNLSKQDRHKINRLLLDIQDDCLTNGVHSERLKTSNGKILKSYRASDDLRLVLYKWRSDEWLAITCGHHDETYKRVSRMDLSVQGSTELPVVKILVKEMLPVVPLVVPSDRFHPVHTSKTFAFGQMPDDDLIKVGVPKGDLQKLRDATCDDDVLEIINDYDSIVQERVLELVDNPLCLAEMVRRVAAEKPRRTISQIIKTNPEDGMNYFMLTQENQSQFFAGDIENWQVLLHPSQLDSVKMEAKGPAMITGAAGTGKTVVAVHRAKWLLENKFRNEERILFTTYVTTLVDSVKIMLRTICSPEQLGRIDVVNLDSILRNEFGRFRHGAGIEFDEEEVVYQFLTNIVESEKIVYTGMRSIRFLAKEYVKVILEFGIQSLDEYKRVERSGLLGRVDREKERPKLWPIFEILNKVFQSGADNVGRTTALNLLTAAINSGEYSPKTRYASVIVDEAQDFGAPEYRFLAALTGNRYDRPMPHSLFICGDGHQRVYGRSGSLKECGINVHSRSRALEVCYRSTRKIREYAENILCGVETRDMNGDNERFAGVASLEEGVPPVEKFFLHGDYDAMNDFIIESFKKWHDNGVRYSDMAVFLRNAGRFKGDERYLYNTAKTLNDNGIPAVQVSRQHRDPGGETVKVMTMHRAKGLQFHGVVINLTHWPHHDNDAKEEAQLKSELDQEKQLLYMAIMRATSRVVITGTTGRPEKLPFPTTDNSATSTSLAKQSSGDEQVGGSLSDETNEKIKSEREIDKGGIYDKFIAYLANEGISIDAAVKFRGGVKLYVEATTPNKSFFRDRIRDLEAALIPIWDVFCRKESIFLTLISAAEGSCKVTTPSQSTHRVIKA